MRRSTVRERYAAAAPRSPTRRGRVAARRRPARRAARLPSASRTHAVARCSAARATTPSPEPTALPSRRRWDAACRRRSPVCATATSCSASAPVGAGEDGLISGRRVGPSGRVIGLGHDRRDARPRARERRAPGIDNVAFVKGYLEELPLPDASVDVVISNCVINLSGDKARVSREAAHVLRAAGAWRSPMSSPTPTWTTPRGPTRRAGPAASQERSPARSSSARSRGRPRGHRDPRDPSRPRARRRSDGPRAQAGALLQRLALRYAPPSTHAPRSRSLPSKFS
jgi:SAM-dependent methyltransferase